ncbi:tRNA pseudouridine(38-40) synthase TruA [Fusibacter bizertensis]
MQTVHLKMIYDGSVYHGWQRQSNHRSVQEEVEKALTKILGGKITIDASGRTDAGVHAIEQSVTFSANIKMPIEQLKFVINGRLPSDIFVSEVNAVDADFHARYSAIAKAYEYRIYTSKDRNPFLDKYSFHWSRKLNIDAIKFGMSFFLGTHNFATYMAAGSNKENTERTIYAFELYEDGDVLKFVIVGDGFLYNMVRIIMGTLLDIGEGKLKPEMVPDILKSGDRNRAKYTAPPSGLYLKKVFYNQEELTEFIAKL